MWSPGGASVWQADFHVGLLQSCGSDLPFSLRALSIYQEDGKESGETQVGDFYGPELAQGHITSAHSLSSVVYSAAREAGKEGLLVAPKEEAILKLQD